MNIRLCLPLVQLLAVMALILPGGIVSAHQSSTIDLRIWTVNSAGEPVYDVCYTLVEYSNPGCDENRDGNVLFQDIPPGRYYVEPTMQPDGFYWAEPFTILVDQYHTDHVVEAYEYRSGSGNAPDSYSPVDVHLITRDPATGDVIYDACYELVGYSNIGCDENRDGHISFADIPPSTYTIRQTTTPAGYVKMNDYIVTIMPTGLNDPVTILLSQSRQQAPEGSLNVSVIFYDAAIGNTVQSPENCARFWMDDEAVSNAGCDEDIVDGQVDFMHLEFDPYNDRFSMEVSVVCDYDLVINPYFEFLWVGESSLLVFVEISPNYLNCT